MLGVALNKDVIKIITEERIIQVFVYVGAGSGRIICRLMAVAGHMVDLTRTIGAIYLHVA